MPGFSGAEGRVANLSITTLCNRSCSYCFASPERRAGASGPVHMDGKTFASAHDFLARSGVAQVRLMGGEPTLHPRIVEFLAEIRARGLSAVIFSNGLIPERVLRHLDSLPEGGISLLINATADEANAGAAVQPSVLKRLGRKAMLGVNIAAPAVGLSALLDRVEESGLFPLVRLGLAHPCLGGGNEFLHPVRYPAVGGRLGPFREEARRRGIRLSYDCGFVPCLFSRAGPAELEEIVRDVTFGCGPIPDILPDGSLVPCYPLAPRFREGPARLRDSSADEVRARLEARLAPFRGARIYRECEDCPFLQEGICPGGCLAAALGRLRKPGPAG